MTQLTSFLENLQAYEVEKAALDRKVPALKKAFEAFIRDKNIPLMKRWSIFRDAPEELKNHTSTLILRSTVAFTYIHQHWFNAPEIYGRGKQINLAQKIEDYCNFDTEQGFCAEDGFDAYQGTNVTTTFR